MILVRVLSKLGDAVLAVEGWAYERHSRRRRRIERYFGV